MSAEKAGRGEGASVRHEIAFRTHIGHAHSVNQDAGGAWVHVRDDAAFASLLVVADGVSAGKRSEEASRLVVDVIAGRLLPLIHNGSAGIDSLLDALADATRIANHEVALRPYESQRTADATTLAAVVCVGSMAAGLWCGDSRVYQIAGEVRRLTHDHSWAEGVVRGGLMTVEQAARDPRAHLITRWIGPPEQEDPGLETFRCELRAGDTILCCSDGLYRYFEPPSGREDEMLAAIGGTPLEQAVDGLVKTALRRGGNDNIAASALRVLGPESATPPQHG